jgi:WD40 repeat protein/serine/threonine protein kinase/Flp pilus assembly protein TadD
MPSSVRTQRSGPLGAELEPILERFTRAWQAGERPVLEDFLKASGGQRRLLLIELIHEDLELRLKSGEHVRVETYCQRFPEIANDSAVVLDLVAAEYLLRRERDPDFSPCDYEQRFPALHGQLAAHIQKLEKRPEALAANWQTADTLVPVAAAAADGQARAAAADNGRTPPRGEGTARPMIPGYEILEELGRGGMGVVYKARQVGLGRLVALKMILAGSFAGDKERARFQTEAEAVARLQHANIVQIHDIGTHDGLPYFSLEFVDGGSLAARLDGTPLPWEEAARFVAILARAVHHAHERGIIHRDLKPGNILLASGGRKPPDAKEPSGGLRPPLANCVLKITDFGLAKKLDVGEGHTQSGAIVGTPSYMAPEQAGGHQAEIGPTVDVYALGAILYELLTGRPPFKAATSLDTVLQVVSEEPVPPSRLNPKLPRDLETICLKCLRKQPGRRYASALALAEDLQRLCAGEPIQARPVGRLERSGKWMKKHPAASALYAMIGLVVATLLVAMPYVSWRESQLRRVAEANEVKAQTNLATAKANAMRAEANEKRADQSKAQLRTLTDLRGITTAYQDWRSGNIIRPRQLLNDCPSKLRGWDWHFVNRMIQPVLLSLPAGKARITSVKYTPDGKLLLAASLDGKIRIWQAATGRLIRILTAHRQPLPITAKDFDVYGLAVSPDGNQFAAGAGDNTVVVWDTATGAERLRLRGHAGLVRDVAFGPDGKRLASTARDGSVRIWDLASGKAARVFRLSEQEAVQGIAFGPDGKFATTGSKVRLWEEATGKSVILAGHAMESYGLAFSPQGRFLAAACGIEGLVRIWNPRTGQLVTALPGHPNYVLSVAFSPDGLHLASCGWKAELMVWETRSWQVHRQRGGLATLAAAAFSPDTQEIAVGDWDGTIQSYRAYDTTDGRVIRDDARITAAAVAADGRRIIVARENPTMKNWTMHYWSADHGWENTYFGQGGTVETLALSRDGKWWASGSVNNTLILWEVANYQKSYRFEYGGQVKRVVFSPDGNWLGVATSETKARLVNPASIKSQRGGFVFAGQDLPHPSPVNDLVFTSDSKRLVSAAQDGHVYIWDVATGQYRPTISGLPGGAKCVALAPDDRLCAVADGHDDIHLYDLTRGKEFGKPLTGHTWGINKLLFSPDGSRLVSCGGDGSVRFWHPGTGQNTLIFAGHAGPVRDIAFTPDGRQLISASLDGTLRVWDADPRVKPSQQRDAYLTERLPRHHEEMRQAWRDRQLYAYDFHATRWLAAHPNDADALSDRAIVHAQQGRFAQAAADIKKAVALSDKDPIRRVRLLVPQILLQAAADEEEDARTLIRLALLAMTFSSDAEGQLMTAAVATLLPDAADGKDLVRRIEAAMKKVPKEPYLHTCFHAAALYRAGRLEDARREFERACAEHAGGGLPWDWFFLAMIHHRQGRLAEARRWQRKARTWLENSSPDTPLSIPMFDRQPDIPVGIMWLVYRIIGGEADRVCSRR